MEYVVSSLFAIALSIPFAHLRTQSIEEKFKKLEERVELVDEEHKDRFERLEGVVQVIDREVPNKMVSVLQPVAVAVKELQSTIGLQ